MVANLNLKMHLMDVVIAYLYGSLGSKIYMRVPEGIKPQHVQRSPAAVVVCVETVWKDVVQPIE